MLGGDFGAVATSVGLKPTERFVDGATVDGATADDALPWRGLDVGQPVRLRPAGDPVRRPAPAAARPRRPGRGPRSTRSSSWSTPPRAAPSGCSRRRRAAEAAAEAVRERLPHLTTLAQGDAQLPELAAQFVERPAHLPVRHAQPVAGARRPRRHLPAGAHRPDPVPAPRRPADVSARQKAADQAGGNGFMQVAATHAALLLAQGAGPADPHHHRPRRRRRARPAAGDGALRRLPQGQPAADVDHHRPGRGPQGAGPARRRLTRPGLRRRPTRV